MGCWYYCNPNEIDYIDFHDEWVKTFQTSISTVNPDIYIYDYVETQLYYCYMHTSHYRLIWSSMIQIKHLTNVNLPYLFCICIYELCDCLYPFPLCSYMASSQERPNKGMKDIYNNHWCNNSVCEISYNHNAAAPNIFLIIFDEIIWWWWQKFLLWNNQLSKKSKSKNRVIS